MLVLHEQAENLAGTEPRIGEHQQDGRFPPRRSAVRDRRVTTRDGFERAAGGVTLAALTAAAVERTLADRRTLVEPITAHRTYRTLRTFSRWCVRTGRLAADPVRDMTMRLPKTLPRVPDDEDVRRLLAACGQAFAKAGGTGGSLPEAGNRKAV